MKEFNHVTIEERKLIRPYLLQSDNCGCEFCFGNGFLWDVNNQLYYCETATGLILRWKNEDGWYYYTPGINTSLKEYVDIVEQDAKTTGENYVIGSLPESLVEEFEQQFGDRYRVEENRDFDDYIYSVEELAYLNGKKFHKKKNHLNSFLKEYDFVYEEMKEDNLWECMQMEERWYAAKLAQLEARGELDETVKQSLATEKLAIASAIRYWKELDLEGGLIRINGQVEAFTFGETMGKAMFDTHFEKAMDSFRGLYPAINQQFARNTLLGRYTYVNREEDMGMEGLRQAKLSYQPVKIFKKYVAVLK